MTQVCRSWPRHADIAFDILYPHGTWPHGTYMGRLHSCCTLVESCLALPISGWAQAGRVGVTLAELSAGMLGQSEELGVRPAGTGAGRRVDQQR